MMKLLSNQQPLPYACMLLSIFCWGTSFVAAQSGQKDNAQQTPPDITEPYTLPALTEWVDMQPTGALASFKAPVKPRYVERTFAPVQGQPPIKVKLHLATTPGGASTFIFGYHDLHEAPADEKAVDETLAGAVRGSIANVLGQKLTQVRKINLAKDKSIPGREFSYRFAQGDKIFVVSSRLMLRGQRQYQMSMVMLQDDYDGDIARKFFASLKFLEPVPIKEGNDIPVQAGQAETPSLQQPRSSPKSSLKLELGAEK